LETLRFGWILLRNGPPKLENLTINKKEAGWSLPTHHFSRVVAVKNFRGVCRMGMFF